MKTIIPDCQQKKESAYFWRSIGFNTKVEKQHNSGFMSAAGCFPEGFVALK